MKQINYDCNSTAKPERRVTLPGSKSIAARLLILDYINNRGGVREGLPDCDDTRYLAQAMEELYRTPFGGKFDLGSGAASLRFFVALASSIEGFVGEIDTSPQLRRRPLAPLVDALRSVGAEITYLNNEGYPPLYIKGKKLWGGRIEVNGEVSSQFVSAILMASLLWEKPADIVVTGEQVSTPYIELTRRLIEGGEDYRLEADWSAAAFFYEVALLCPGKEIRIEGLTPPERSLQGDSGIVGLFNLLGVETRWLENGDAIVNGDASIIEKMKKMGTTLELNLGDMPDVVPALAVGMSLAGIRFRFINIGHLRHKESNRLEALKTELEKIGISVETTADTLEWNGARLPIAENEVIECRDDHRIAMAFAPAAAKLGYVVIRDPQCVDKSFPDYFRQLEKIGFA